MKYLLPILTAIIVTACSSTPAKVNLADKISRYSELDEQTAKVAMDESCNESVNLNIKFSDITKRLNASLDEDLQQKRKLSDKSIAISDELKSFDQAKLDETQHQCINDRSTYSKILEVRYDASKRAMNMPKPILPPAPVFINCTSTMSGNTVYTRCM